jgi:hypothetical protein
MHETEFSRPGIATISRFSTWMGSPSTTTVSGHCTSTSSPQCTRRTCHSLVYQSRYSSASSMKFGIHTMTKAKSFCTATGYNYIVQTSGKHDISKQSMCSIITAANPKLCACLPRPSSSRSWSRKPSGSRPCCRGGRRCQARRT